MIRSIPALLVGLSVFVASGVAAREDEKEKKAPKLAGTWVQIGYENYGEFKEIPEAERGTQTFEKGKLRIKAPALKLDKELPYSVDDSKSPRHLDFTIKVGDKEQKVQCLYEIVGDTLRIARPFDGPRGPRPTEMKSGVQAQIDVYKRKKE